jgi:hypothetical protein
LKWDSWDGCGGATPVRYVSVQDSVCAVLGIVCRTVVYSVEDSVHDKVHVMSGQCEGYSLSCVLVYSGVFMVVVHRIG